jgi:PAS domain S-box-containing protein
MNNTDYYPPLGLWQENYVYPSADGLSVFIRDITEKKKAELAVRNSEEVRRLIMSSALDAIVCINRDGAITVWNPQAEKMFGWKETEITGKTLTETIIPKKYRNIHTQGFSQYLETGEARVLNRLIEITALKRSGEEFPIELAIVPIRQQGEEFFCAFIRDITERKDAEEKLKHSYEEIRQLALHLQDVREEERASMSREIHDELGQQLTGLRMDFSWFFKKTTIEDKSMKEKTEHTMELLDNMVKTDRKIATELRPSILDDFGLVEALRWQSKEFQKRSGIKTGFNSALTELHLTSNAAIALFRIYQESLTNVARHAAATSVLTLFEQKNGNLILTIRDNGKGFDPGKTGQKKTLGLLGMKERTLMMGGVYEIKSKPGKGTTVSVVVPLQSHIRSEE